MFKSWKTSLAGVATFFTATWSQIALIIDNDPTTVADYRIIIAAALVMFGLVGARDNNVSSEEAGASN